MAVQVDPGRLDGHHRGHERREEDRLEIGAIQHARIVNVQARGSKSENPVNPGI